MKRYAMRRDENEPDIIVALESCGCVVYQLDTPCDLLVGRTRLNMLMEVKNPDKPKSDRKLTPAQRKFLDTWPGQYDVVETPEQALAVVTRLTIGDRR